MGEDQAQKEVKVVIAGSRDIQDEQHVFDALDSVLKLFTDNGLRITEVVSGGARGPDKLGEKWAIERDIEVRVMPADWDRIGKRAGMVRNAQMADYADAAIIFWDGHSRGTANMISNMKMRDKPCHVIRI